jgi:serine O-acetyltransferase
MWRTVQRDIQVVLERDPAARNALEVVFCYPGFHALYFYRLARWLWQRRLFLLGRLVSQLGRAATAIEIHPGAKIGDGFFIDHGMGVVIGETSEIGDDVTLYQGVTLGGVSLEKTKRHPTLRDRVVVGAGAKILGPITVGENSRIGANAVIVKDVPPNSVVVGVPGRITSKDGKRLPREEPRIDLHHEVMPDVVSRALDALADRVRTLENNASFVRAPQTLMAAQPALPPSGSDDNGRIDLAHNVLPDIVCETVNELRERVRRLEAEVARLRAEEAAKTSEV